MVLNYLFYFRMLSTTTAVRWWPLFRFLRTRTPTSLTTWWRSCGTKWSSRAMSSLKKARSALKCTSFKKELSILWWATGRSPPAFQMDLTSEVKHLLLSQACCRQSCSSHSFLFSTLVNHQFLWLSEMWSMNFPSICIILKSSRGRSSI